MANSTQTVVSDGSLALLDISFDYLFRSEITVYFDSVLTVDWAWVGVSDKQITFDPVVPDGVTVLVKRTTSIAALLHEFSLGAAFTATSLDQDLKQVLHIVQEAYEAANPTSVPDPTSDYLLRTGDIMTGPLYLAANATFALQPTTKQQVDAGLATKQASNVNLAAEAGLSGVADTLSYYTGVGAKALTNFFGWGRTFLASATIAAARESLGTMFNATDAKSANYTAVLADRGKVLDFTGTRTLALTAVATLGVAYSIAVRNSGTGVITINPDGTETIDGVTSIDLAAGESCIVVANDVATGWKTVGRVITPTYGALLQLDSQFTSGAYSFTKPIGATRARVCIVGGGGAYYTAVGGGGGYSEKVVDVSALSAIAGTVGAGGAGGANNGASTTVTSPAMTASGGFYDATAASTASGGDINLGGSNRTPNGLNFRYSDYTVGEGGQSTTPAGRVGMVLVYWFK